MESKNLTDGALFDALHEAYGVGEIKPGEEWYKTRLREIGIAKRVRESRKLDIQTMFRALDYAKATHKDIRHVSWLPSLVKEADRWYLAQLSEKAGADLEEKIGRAIAYEYESDPEGDWLERLTRARGSTRSEVYREWEVARG